MFNQEQCITLAQRIVDLDDDSTSERLCAYANDVSNMEFFSTLECVCAGASPEKTRLVTAMVGLAYLGFVELGETS